jgi:hypothetical protein
MNIDIMSHEQVTCSRAVERYVLGELTPEEREAFENHYFDCRDCYEQVKLEMQFLSRSRQVLDPEPEKGWLARLLGDLRRPAPAFACALLLCTLGMSVYQQSIIADLGRPRVEAAHLVFHGQSRSGVRSAQSPKLVNVSRKGNISLTVQFTPTPEYSSYEARILSGSGRVQYSLPLPDTGLEEGSTVTLPASTLRPEKYSIVVEGSNHDGVKEEIAGGDFELRFID